MRRSCEATVPNKTSRTKRRRGSNIHNTNSGVLYKDEILQPNQDIGRRALTLQNARGTRVVRPMLAHSMLVYLVFCLDVVPHCSFSVGLFNVGQCWFAQSSQPPWKKQAFGQQKCCCQNSCFLKLKTFQKTFPGPSQTQRNDSKSNKN